MTLEEFRNMVDTYLTEHPEQSKHRVCVYIPNQGNIQPDEFREVREDFDEFKYLELGKYDT